MFRMPTASLTLSLALAVTSLTPAKAQTITSVNPACWDRYVAITAQAAKGLKTIIPLSLTEDDKLKISADHTGGVSYTFDAPSKSYLNAIKKGKMDTAMVIWSAPGATHPIRYVFMSDNAQQGTCMQFPETGKNPLFMALQHLDWEFLVLIKLGQNRYRADNTVTYFIHGQTELTQDDYDATNVLTEDDLRKFIREFSD